MDEPVALPPGSKAYYRSAVDGEWQELGTFADVAGVDPAEAGDRTVISEIVEVGGEMSMTWTGQMDPETHAALVKKLAQVPRRRVVKTRIMESRYDTSGIKNGADEVVRQFERLEKAAATATSHAAKASSLLEGKPIPKAKPAVARHVAGRNERCPCGSGRKYKKCHLGRSMAQLIVKEEV